MSKIIPSTFRNQARFIPTSKSVPDGLWDLARNRSATDILFYADITMQNMVVGSRYWITQSSNLSNVLATGVATQSEFTITHLPAYTNPMLLLVRARKASESPYYKPYDTYTNLTRSGAIVYIAQELDE